jgi:hypothetical protein
MAFAATVIAISAGATPVLLVSGGGNTRPRNAIVQNITTPVGSLAAVGYGSASQTPSGMFYPAGTQPFAIECRRGQDVYVVHNSAALQTLSILMDLL